MKYIKLYESFMDDILNINLSGKIIVRSGYLDTDPKEICVITKHNKDNDITTRYWLYPIARIENGVTTFVDSINRLHEVDTFTLSDYRELTRKEKKLVQDFFNNHLEIKEKIEEKVKIKI